jgi:hypothetical protein
MNRNYAAAADPDEGSSDPFKGTDRFGDWD